MWGLIWTTRELSSDRFGAIHWLLLIAAWYAALHELRPDLAEDSDAVSVMGGWYYRNIVKTAQRTTTDEAWLESLFDHCREPELVFLLDTAPSLAWDRGGPTG